MKSPEQILHENVLKNLPKEPLATQADLYRALAALAATPQERANYGGEAAQCDALIAQHAAHAARHEQLVIDFRLRAL